jgi:predicted ester cyclase
VQKLIRASGLALRLPTRPSTWHHVKQYANDPIEADHGQLKRRLRPMRGLQTVPARRRRDGEEAGHLLASGVVRSDTDVFLYLFPRDEGREVDEMSSTEQNKAIARRFLDLVSEHDIEGLIAMISSDWTMQGGPPDLPTGAEGIRILFGTFGHIEQTWTVDQILAEGDLVAVRATNACAQDSFLGVPADGKPQVFTATFMHRITDGLIQQTWRNADDLGRLLQLGARIEPPAC